MISAQSTAAMYTSMLMATAVLIGTVAVLVAVGFVVYYKTDTDPSRREDGHDTS